MSSATLFGLCGAALVGLGLYGMIVHSRRLRRILSFDVLGSGIFLIFGAVARRGAAADLASDPIPQAMVITGLVVAFAATGVAAALLLRLCEESGDGGPRSEEPP
jgi:multicomponent Na+:H+ antiporter subunit C